MQTTSENTWKPLGSQNASNFNMVDVLRTRGHIRKNYEDVDWQDSGDQYLGDSSDDEE